MENLLKIIVFIEENLTAIIAITTSIALALAHIIRFLRCQQLGVVSRISFASVYDSIEVIVELFAIVGFGLIIPLLLLSSDIDSIPKKTLMVLLIAFSYFPAVSFFINKIRQKLQEIKPKVIKISVFVLFAFSGFVVWSLSRISTGESRNLAIAGTFIHITLLLIMFAWIFALRLSGNYRAENTCYVNGTMYLVGVRHTSNEWLLLRCRVEDTKTGGRRKNKIIFVPDKYIVKNLTDVGEITARPTYTISAEKM